MVVKSRTKHVVDMPWGMRYPGVYLDKAKRVNIFEGELPPGLREYKSEDFSYERWIEDDINGSVQRPLRGENLFQLRDHQKVAANAILNAYANKSQGFLEADKTGLGKTLSCLAGIAYIMSKDSRYRDGKRVPKILIVCPKRVIPVWRNTLRAYPQVGVKARILIINYQSMKKLITKPSKVAKAKKSKTKNRIIAREGKPTVNWDFIIFDESHYLKNYPQSETSVLATNLAQMEKPYRRGSSPFVICATATPGASPLNLAYLAPWLGKLISRNSQMVQCGLKPSEWGEFLFNEGFNVKQGKVYWSWATLPYFGKDSKDPKERAYYKRKLREAKLSQRRDSTVIGKALTSKGAPFIMRLPSDISGWPEQQIVPLPIELDVESRANYKEAWDTFRRFLKLPLRKQDSQAKFVEYLRFRQKSSLLKVTAMVEQVADWVDQGFQVYVSCEFTETVDKYGEGLDKLKIPYVKTTGETSDVEIPRIQFQKGEAKVVLSTLLEGVSFHANEELPDGTKATSAPRITVMSDLRQNNLSNEQAFGRCHRSGENSILYIPYFADTIDETIISRFANKTANMRKMTGASDEEADLMERIFKEVADSTA